MRSLNLINRTATTPVFTKKNCVKNFADFSIKLTFKKSNTYAHVTRANGKTDISETSGNKKVFTGRQKNKKMAISFLVKKLKFKLNQRKITGESILELNGDNSSKNLIFKSLVTGLKLKQYKYLNITPFNGCKARKKKRKKTKRLLLL